MGQQRRFAPESVTSSLPLINGHQRTDPVGPVRAKSCHSRIDLMEHVHINTISAEVTQQTVCHSHDLGSEEVGGSKLQTQRASRDS
jgi:hypothetical protein